METQQDSWWLEDFSQEGEERLSTPKMKTLTQRNTNLPNHCKFSAMLLEGPLVCSRPRVENRLAIKILAISDLAPFFFTFPVCLLVSINPITGHVEEPMPNPIEEMTDEQKEYEAQKLVNMFDKLSR